MSIADAPVAIRTSPQLAPSTPPWFGEATLIVHYLIHLGVLSSIEEQIRFASRRFRHYEIIDFLAVLFGYAISGERPLEAFYERLQPFASAFMALFGRDRLPHRSTLSRFLAALNQTTVEALRTIFLEWRRGNKRAGCGIDRETIGGSLISMAHGRLPANVPCHPPLISPRHNADWTRCVLQAISDASGVKPFGPGPPCSRHIHTNGSARFLGHLGRATAIIGENRGRLCRRSARI